MRNSLKKNYHILLWFFVAMLGSCAPAYVIPKDSPTAKLRFINKITADQSARLKGSVVMAKADVTGCIQSDNYTREHVLDVAKGTSLASEFGLEGKDGEKETSSIRMLGTSGEALANVREREIEAGKIFIFDIHSVYLNLSESEFTGFTRFTKKYTCIIFGSFAPESSAEYEIEHNNDIGQGGSCSAVIYRLRAGAQGEVLKTKESSQRYYKGKEFCDAGK
jgi:hypothetical protein